MRTIVMFVALAGAAGCGGGSTAETGPAAPLTVADWKALSADAKYAPETLERLKKGDPALETAEGWEQFQKTVVAPSRKKDFPNGKR